VTCPCDGQAYAMCRFSDTLHCRISPLSMTLTHSNHAMNSLIYEFRTPFERSYVRETSVTKCNFQHFNWCSSWLVQPAYITEKRYYGGTYNVEGKHVLRQRSQKLIIQSVQSRNKDRSIMANDVLWSGRADEKWCTSEGLRMFQFDANSWGITGKEINVTDVFIKLLFVKSKLTL